MTRPNDPSKGQVQVGCSIQSGSVAEVVDSVHLRFGVLVFFGR